VNQEYLSSEPIGMKRSRERGVTLLELMTVVVVLGILAAIAIPSYRSYLIRAQRSDATSALLRVAAAQEKFYLQNNRYATDDELDKGPPAGLGITGSEHGYYQLALDDALDNTLAFTATATPVAGGAQATDNDCTSFSIDQTGKRGALKTDTDNTPNCWR
jgi:type IV pilus assembly protein PilE